MKLRQNELGHWTLDYTGESWIRELDTVDTGGNITNDIISLTDGTVIVISDETVALYASRRDYENNNQEHAEFIRRYDVTGRQKI